MSAEAAAEPLAADGAAVTVAAGPAEVKARLSPAGAVAIGALVSAILLSSAAIVWVSLSPARRHPLLTALSLRR
jgi:hypothetical protein